MMAVSTIPAYLRQGTTTSKEAPVIWTTRPDRTTRRLKQLVWAYFLLLIFEGALRKWFLPGLAAPLLVVRDPIALWGIGLALSRKRLKANGYLTGMLWIGIMSLFTAMLTGHGNLIVALFGLRILLIHFPFMFVIGQCMEREDVEKIGKAILVIAGPMTVLIALQFYSPQSAWVNLGVGADTAGAGFSGALGYFRPPATFSFTNGTTLYYSLAGSFVCYFWLNSQKINRIVLVVATVGLLASIPLSISRSLFFQVLVTVAFMTLAVARKPKYLGQLLLAAIGVAVGIAMLSNTAFYQTSLTAFTERFETANESEGGLSSALIDRFLGGAITALTNASDQSLTGFGIGMGTNVGAQLLAGNRNIFLIAEGEWGRLIGELGAVLGVGAILIRVVLSINCFIGSYRHMKSGDLLPWLLLSFGMLQLLQAGWAQPTSLGFSTLVGGLLLASLRKPDKNSN